MNDIKYVVWNGNKTEGFVTSDYPLAYEVRKSASSNCYDSSGTPSPTAVAFCQAWWEDNCTLEAYMLYISAEKGCAWMPISIEAAERYSRGNDPVLSKASKSEDAFLALLKIADSDPPIYFVKTAYTDATDELEYFYESKMCPKDQIAAEAVLQDGDIDPHGVFEFVEAIPKPADWPFIGEVTYERYRQVFTKLPEDPAPEKPSFEEVLKYGGPLCSDIDKIISEALVTFLKRRDSGISASLNGAFDYTVLSILDAVKAAIENAAPQKEAS